MKKSLKNLMMSVALILCFSLSLGACNSNNEDSKTTNEQTEAKENTEAKEQSEQEAKEEEESKEENKEEDSKEDEKISLID